PPLGSPGCSALFGLLAPVGLTIESVDLGMMNEAIDEGDDAGSVGEHLVPFAERTVGGDDRARLLVAARDEFKKEVGVTVGVGEVADLIDDEEARTYVAAQAPAQRGIAVERGEITEHMAGGGKQHGMTGDDGLVSDILGDHRLAESVWCNEDHVAWLLEEVEGHQRFDCRSVTALGPSPIEVAQRLEAADMGFSQPSLERASCTLLLFPIEQRWEPSAGGRFLPMGKQAIKIEGLGPELEGIEISVHRRSP